MKYLKRYNEELRPSAYTSAGARLKNLGHNRRGEELIKWGEEVSKRNKDIASKKKLEEAKKLGVYKMKLVHKKWIQKPNTIDGRTVSNTHSFYTIMEGNFYISIFLEPSTFRENYLEWLNNGQSFQPEFGLSIIPADEETKKSLLSEIDDTQMYLGAYFVNWMYITFGKQWDGEEEPELNPDGTIIFESGNGDDLMALFVDRKSAMQFKKTLVDIFNGRIIYGETTENPGGIKEFILDYLCSEQNRSLEEFERIIKSISRINVNKLYLD